MANQLSLNKESLGYAYFIANTPSDLYRLMRLDFSVITLSQKSSEEIIELFESKREQKLTTREDLAEIYGLLIALTLKHDEVSNKFFKDVILKIKFEWFSDIAKIYLSGYVPIEVTSYSVTNSDVKKGVVPTDTKIEFSSNEN